MSRYFILVAIMGVLVGWFARDLVEHVQLKLRHSEVEGVCIAKYIQRGIPRGDIYASNGKCVIIWEAE